MAEQFEVTQQEVAYRPEQATDFVREFDRHIAERDALRKPYEASLANRSQQEINDADRKLKELGELSKLSDTLLKQLTEIQKDKNEEQYAQGLADQLLDGPDLEGQATLETEENELVAGQSVATRTADKYKAEGGSEANAREIRNTGGWYGYGRFVGQLQQLGDNYGAAFSEAKSSFKINIDGEELGYDQLQTKDEYNTWTRAFQQQYLKVVPRTNGDVVEKYVLREVRATSNAERASWTAEWEQKQEAIEKEGRFNSFTESIKLGELNIAERAFATYPGSFLEIREEISKNLVTLIDAGQITPEAANNFWETQTIVKDGKRKTMAEAFGTQYALFQDQVQNAQAKENKEFRQAQQNAGEELYQTLTDGPPLSDLEQAELMTKFANNPYALDVLQNHKTQEDLDDIYSEAYLDSMYDSNQLTEEMLKKFPKRIQDKYKQKVSTMGAIAEDFDEKDADLVAEMAARHVSDIKDGTVASTKDFKFQNIFENAKQVYKQTYMDARRNGMLHEDAAKYARQRVKELAETNNSPLLAVQQPLQVSGRVQEARKFIANTENAINTQVIPNSKEELANAVEFLRTRRGTMPGFYVALAAGKPYTAEELVLKQASLAGMDIKDLKQVEFVKEKQNFRPAIQRLLSVSPNRQTFAQATSRAVIGSDNTKFFLDQVASKESASYGHYDAYNLGGSDGGFTAHDSGNSAEDNRFGKPVSQLTLGEIKTLHRTGKAHAMGRYQFIGTTFAEVARLTGLPDSAVFDAKTQDLFAITRLIQRASWGNLQTGLKSEWIGLNHMGSYTYQKVLEAARQIVAERTK